jgi:murein L,D-transpeptidase YafK
MRRAGRFLIVLLVFGLAGCGGERVTKSTLSPELVDRVLVVKDRRKLYLMQGDAVVRSYPVGLGFAPDGDKLHRGDGRTPEGRYRIDRRNPESDFFLSLGISYPDRRDWDEAMAQGLHPGSDIFIHGEPSRGQRPPGRDWTAGCIAVSDSDMAEIWQLVRDGTIIDIVP